MSVAIIAEDGVVVFVVGVLLADDTVAAFSGVVVPVVAGLAEMTAVLVARIIVPPDPLAAASADDGAVLEAVGTDQRVAEAHQLLHRVQRLTHPTGFHFTHKHTSIIRLARGEYRLGLSTWIICGQKVSILRRNEGT